MADAAVAVSTYKRLVHLLRILRALAPELELKRIPVHIHLVAPDRAWIHKKLNIVRGLH